MGEPAHGVNGRKSTKIMFDRPRRGPLLSATMKKLLSLLMCYVFLQAETFALRGGPNQVGGQKVLGAYSGVMVETSGGTDMGLFLLNAVGSGASNGQVLIFSANSYTGNIFQFDSDTYLGTISGLSDTSRGGSGKFVGIFNGSASTGNATARSVSGQMSVTAIKSGSSSTQRLTGTASSRTVSVSTGAGNFATNVGSLVIYSVDGWLTSSSAVGTGLSTGGP